VGTGDSVALQVGSGVYPLTVNTAGMASEALAEAGVTPPLAQERDTVTLLPLLGTKSLLTVNVATLSVLTIAQDPAESAAEHVPVEE
jgi:hypothetical protein